MTHRGVPESGVAPRACGHGAPPALDHAREVLRLKRQVLTLVARQRQREVGERGNALARELESGETEAETRPLAAHVS